MFPSRIVKEQKVLLQEKDRSLKGAILLRKGNLLRSELCEGVAIVSYCHEIYLTLYSFM